MAINYKVIQRGQPGVAGGGVKKYYAIPVLGGEMTMDELTAAIEKNCTVTGADIRAVVYALVDVSITSLARGSILRLGDLGSLRMSLSSDGKEKEDDVNASTIRGSSIIFTPGRRMQTTLANMKYQKQ